MKYINIILVILITSFNAFSQESKVITINNADIKPIVKNFYFKEIIDWRYIRENIGFCQTGAFNKRKDLVFASDFSIELKNYFGLKVKNTGNAEPLFLIINNFWVSERTSSFSEKGIFSINALVCKKDTSGNYIQLYEYENLIEESGMDVTTKHSDRIITALNILIEEFSNLTLDKYENMTIFKTYFNEKENITNSELLKPGFYKNFIELYNNDPSSKMKPNLKMKLKENSRYILKDTVEKKRIGNYYGFCDGNDIFINITSYGGYYNIHDKQFEKVMTIGRYLFIDDSYLDNATGAVYSQLGLVGAIVTSASTKNFGILDTKTGKFTFFSNKSFLEFLKPYPDMYERYKKKYDPDNIYRAAVIRKINEKEAGK